MTKTAPPWRAVTGRVGHWTWRRYTGQMPQTDKAAHVNGQVFGRRGYAFTLFQTPRPIAAMYKEGGWTAAEIAANFDAAFGEHLQQIGIPQTKR